MDLCRCFRLEIRHASEGAHHVPGIVEARVEHIKEVWDVLQAGSNARAVGSNNINEHSSRSHWLVKPNFPSLHILRKRCENYSLHPVCMSIFGFSIVRSICPVGEVTEQNSI